MKTKRKFLMTMGLIIFALFTGTTFASNIGLKKLPVPHHIAIGSIPAFNVELKQLPNSEKIRLIVDNPEGKYLSVTLRDPSGEVVVHFVGGKKLKQLVKVYDFLGAEEGVYKLEIYDWKDKVKKEINLQRVQQEYITIQ
jgi:hypothetical protein